MANIKGRIARSISRPITHRISDEIPEGEDANLLIARIARTIRPEMDEEEKEEIIEELGQFFRSTRSSRTGIEQADLHVLYESEFGPHIHSIVEERIHDLEEEQDHLHAELQRISSRIEGLAGSSELTPDLARQLRGQLGSASQRLRNTGSNLFFLDNLMNRMLGLNQGTHGLRQGEDLALLHQEEEPTNALMKRMRRILRGENPDQDADAALARAAGARNELLKVERTRTKNFYRLLGFDALPSSEQEMGRAIHLTKGKLYGAEAHLVNDEIPAFTNLGFWRRSPYGGWELNPEGAETFPAVHLRPANIVPEDRLSELGIEALEGPPEGEPLTAFGIIDHRLEEKSLWARMGKKDTDLSRYEREDILPKIREQLNIRHSANIRRNIQRLMGEAGIDDRELGAEAIPFRNIMTGEITTSSAVEELMTGLLYGEGRAREPYEALLGRLARDQSDRYDDIKQVLNTISPDILRRDNLNSVLSNWAKTANVSHSVEARTAEIEKAYSDEQELRRSALGGMTGRTGEFLRFGELPHAESLLVTESPEDILFNGQPIRTVADQLAAYGLNTGPARNVRREALKIFRAPESKKNVLFRSLERRYRGDTAFQNDVRALSTSMEGSKEKALAENLSKWARTVRAFKETGTPIPEDRRQKLIEQELYLRNKKLMPRQEIALARKLHAQMTRTVAATEDEMGVMQGFKQYLARPDILSRAYTYTFSFNPEESTDITDYIENAAERNPFIGDDAERAFQQLLSRTGSTFRFTGPANSEVILNNVRRLSSPHTALRHAEAEFGEVGTGHRFFQQLEFQPIIPESSDLHGIARSYIESRVDWDRMHIRGIGAIPRDDSGTYLTEEAIDREAQNLMGRVEGQYGEEALIGKWTPISNTRLTDRLVRERYFRFLAGKAAEGPNVATTMRHEGSMALLRQAYTRTEDLQRQLNLSQKDILSKVMVNDFSTLPQGVSADIFKPAISELDEELQRHGLDWKTVENISHTFRNRGSINMTDLSEDQQRLAREILGLREQDKYINAPLGRGNFVPEAFDEEGVLHSVGEAADAISEGQQLQQLFAQMVLNTKLNRQFIQDYLPQFAHMIPAGATRDEMARIIAEAGGPDMRVSVPKRLLGEFLAHRTKGLMSPELEGIFGQSQAEAIRRMRPGGSTTPLEDAGRMAKDAFHKPQTPINFAQFKRLFNTNKLAKYGTLGVGAFIGAGILRASIRRKDKSLQDMQGPPYLPGGNPYQYGPMSGPEVVNYPISSSGIAPTGVEYQINAQGNYNPDALRGSIANLLGTNNINGSAYSVPAPAGQDNSDYINNSY